MKVGFREPERPLDAVAVAARGALARQLADHTASRADLRVDAGDGWTVVRGPDLPWLDGVVYLGAFGGQRSLLVPVHAVPAAPPDVLLAAVRRLTGGEPGPFAVLPTDGHVDVAVLEP